MQVVDQCSFSAIDLELIQSSSTRLTPFRYLTQVKGGNGSLLNPNALSKLSKKDGEILDIAWQTYSIAPGTQRDKGARHAHHTGNWTDYIMTKVYAMGTHIPDLA